MERLPRDEVLRTRPTSFRRDTANERRERQYVQGPVRGEEEPIRVADDVFDRAEE